MNAQQSTNNRYDMIDTVIDTAIGGAIIIAGVKIGLSLGRKLVDWTAPSPEQPLTKDAREYGAVEGGFVPQKRLFNGNNSQLNHAYQL